ncbi:rhomboid family intramembrane serine protease [Stieleria varia]|uniref:Rhomboid family protein n=1 Tax=Stieleria varia TaxID=2528005 RepID=A0A5C6AS36_9BACT|nr:rhomboid family intramembrane serine protease [Stieleria varia]TWU02805.1 Rhomboid family protein [Stieleria varia]
MIPLSDNIPSRRTPFVNYIVLAICTAAFLLQITQADSGQSIVQEYGMIPARLSHPDVELVIEQNVAVQTSRGIEIVPQRTTLPPSTIPPWLTVLTCIFLHGGWMHFLGNMWFLYVFGDNVEDRLGHIGFALLYIGTGVIASLSHWATGPDSPIPTIGASGAIAGVMGAYAWLYPHARVKSILPIPIFLYVFVLPAPVFLGIWFAMQTFSGVTSNAETGVAWWAHIGGFIAGAIVALIIGRTPIGSGPVMETRF